MPALKTHKHQSIPSVQFPVLTAEYFEVNAIMTCSSQIWRSLCWALQCKQNIYSVICSTLVPLCCHVVNTSSKSHCTEKLCGWVVFLSSCFRTCFDRNQMCEEQFTLWWCRLCHAWVICVSLFAFHRNSTWPAYPAVSISSSSVQASLSSTTLAKWPMMWTAFASAIVMCSSRIWSNWCRAVLCK